jgi:hypothetical protein
MGVRRASAANRTTPGNRHEPAILELALRDAGFFLESEGWTTTCGNRTN